jgi:hypothetical protein
MEETPAHAGEMTTHLADPTTHRAIHAAAQRELEEAMAVLRRSVRHRPEEAPEVAAVVLSIWEERVLAHAMVEEEALYPLLAGFRQGREEAVALTRDHALLRRWVAEARDLLGREGGMSGACLARLEALILLLAEHQRDEEGWVGRAVAGLAVAEGGMG